MKSLRERAMDYLARREHSRLELQRKLQLKGFALEAIESTLTALETENLLSDQRFAEQFVHRRQAMGYGPRRVVEELKQRGVAAQLIEESVWQDTEGWKQSLQYILQKKFKQKPANWSEKQKQYQYLWARGFIVEDLS